MRTRWGFYLGLGTVASVTLSLEVINARLFSVISWYHLSFVAVSIAMLGMTGGAVYVYLRPGKFTEDRAMAELSFYGLLLALSVPFCHLLIINYRPAQQIRTQDVSAFIQLVLLMATAAVPFFISGVVVAVSLTRIPLSIGRIYFFDLLGASVGCLVGIILLRSMDPSSACFVLGGVSGLASLGFGWEARRGRWTPLAGRSSQAVNPVGRMPTVAVTALLFGFGLYNAQVYPHGIRLTHMKGVEIFADATCDRWNTHSRVVAFPIISQPPFYWGAGRFAPQSPTRYAYLQIDGGAGTFVNEYHPENVSGLDWIKHDVTSLAYHVSGRGSVAVIGVGGGRDILTGLLFGCGRVVGIELNRIFIDLLETEYREFSEIAAQRQVELIHDEGRSYLSRTEERFDLIQMSLIDTFASTSAGAMTLGENGLYTVEAWRTFLRRLQPSGVFTVSRWFSPTDPGETARLISLAAATLLHEGVERPADHVVLASAGRLATLLVSRAPFTAEALATIVRAVERYGFDLLLAPGRSNSDARLGRILGARTVEELLTGVTDAVLDLSPPYDERPFFFNMVRPRAWLASGEWRDQRGGVVQGNLVATDTLMAILAAVVGLVGLSIVLPLLVFGGGHGLGVKRFVASAHYFAAIGFGFMLIQIGLMQRFSVLLGHPVWTLAIVLFSMILFTGIGSLASDGVGVTGRKRLLLMPVGITATIAVTTLTMQPAIDIAFPANLTLRALVALGFTIPVGFVLGFCFPIGMRLVRVHSSKAMPWMWGINGGFGVLGGVVSVIVSMACGISWSLMIGGLCYLSLRLSLPVLQRTPADAD